MTIAYRPPLAQAIDFGSGSLWEAMARVPSSLTGMRSIVVCIHEAGEVATRTLVAADHRIDGTARESEHIGRGKCEHDLAQHAIINVLPASKHVELFRVCKQACLECLQFISLILMGNQKGLHCEPRVCRPPDRKVPPKSFNADLKLRQTLDPYHPEDCGSLLLSMACQDPWAHDCGDHASCCSDRCPGIPIDRTTTAGQPAASETEKELQHGLPRPHDGRMVAVCQHTVNPL